MSFGGFGQNSGPSAPPRAQIPFGSFARPPSSSPPRPISPSNDPSLRWGDAQTSPFKDHGAQAYQMPHGLLPQVASTNPKTTSFARTAEVQYSERTNSPYSQAPVETSKNSRSVIESDRSHLVRYRGPSPPMVSRNNLYVGGQHPQSEEVQQRPISSSTWGNQSKASSSVLITRGPNQSGPMFQTKYADGLHPKRTRSPTLPSTSGVSPEKSVSYSDGHKRSLIDYRDLDAPEAMSSPPLGFESSSSVMVPSRPFTGNRRLSPPDVQASQSKQFQEDMSPVLTTTDAYQSGRMLQTNYAESPLSKRTRSPTTPPTSTGFPQNPAFGVDGHKRTFDFRSRSQSPTPGQTNSTEVSVDGPMHFPALKKTKIPLRSSSDQVFEENLDPSLETERELLAKEKRLARFKDELSQPVQSHSTVRNQKVPAKRQHPSTLGGQKLSEDTMAGMGDAAGGNVSSDYEGVLSSSIIVGLCPDMCPESERAERERKGDLDQYERLDGDRNLTSEFLAVKKYTRTAEREADLIRPMPILQKTMDYLLSLLDEPYDDRFLGLYNFLWDRMRAIRMDLRMQHIFNLEAINLLEQMIRLHIIAMHELCEYTKGEGFSEGFDAHLNIEQMNKTSVELFQLYDDHRKKGIHVPSEREFRGYYALLKLDKHPGYKVEPAELSLDLAKMTPEMRQTPEVLFARDVARACRTGNFIAFFRLARKASYLQACLMHAHFSKLRTQALASLHCGLQMNQGIPITLVAKWLGMEEEEIGNLLEYYGFSVKDFEEPYMVKDNAFMNVENDFPVKRSKLVNRKRSTMIVRDVSLPSQKGSYSDEEVKLLQPKKVPEPIPKPSQSVVPVSATKFLDQEMHDWGTILSPKTNKKNHMDKVSVALTTPEKEMFGQEVQLAPSSPLLVDFSNSSSGHHQSRAEFTHKPKFELVFRNSFGRAKRELETTVPTTPETDEENGFPVIPLDSVVHTPIPQPVSSEDLDDEEETGVMEEEEIGVMEEDQSEEVTTSYYDKEVEEAKLKLMLRLWKRHTAKKRELRERKQLTADAALSSLSMGPPIWQFEVQSGSLGTFNIDHVMSERHEIQARSWSVVNPSEVVAPKLVEKNPDFKCLCWKLVLFSNKETSYADNIEPQNETAVSTANSWLHSKLMPIDNNDNDDLLVSSPGLAIWKNWVPNESGIDLTCCLSVIKSIKSEDQSEAITGASAVLFVLSEHIPMELQKNRLRDYVMLLPPGSHLPLLILSGSSKNESDPSKIAKALGLNEIDKSRVDIFYIVFLKDGDPKKNLDGFLSDEHLREGLEWLGSESPPQIFVRGIKTRELVLSHLNFTLEIVDNMNTPNNCILAFNEALDRSVKKVTAAAHANPNGWPCPEIERLDESSDEYRAVAWYLPSIGWSLASKTQVLMRALNDSKLPPLENDICRISIGRDIESQKSSLESCLIEYLAKTSQMMGLALAQKEAGILLQNFTRLELCNTAYYIVPNWVSIFRRIFSWRLMNLTSSEVSTTFVLERDYFLIPSFEAVDHSESNTFNPHVFQPSLDELIKVGYWPSPQFESNRVEYEAFQRLSPVASDGAGLQTSDDDIFLMENEVSFEDGGSKGYDDHSEVEANNGDNKPMHVAKPTEEADKLSRLLEKCNILQNLIDEKLSFYF